MSEMEDIRNSYGGYEQGNVKERLDQISMFLTYIESKDLRKILVGKEKSVGNIQLQHMEGHIGMDRLIMTLLYNGQMRTAIKNITSMISEFKMTMSIDGEFIKDVTKQELRYKSESHVYNEPVEKPKKKGLFGR